MAKIKFRAPVKSVHGRLGNVIYYNVKGHQYARIYTIPRNPRTVKQQKNRVDFGETVKHWQELPTREKSIYNRMALGKPVSGYNIFISMKMKGIDLILLKRIHKRQATDRLLPAISMRAGTSVSASLLFGKDEHKIKKPGIRGSPGLIIPQATVFSAA
jgi:hypothetical protein